ncbi:MAG: peptidase S8 [Rikenellaceae bacterium]|nr:peptidase S8 [Rikenellaceae bacterium]
MKKVVYSLFAILALAACTADFDSKSKVVNINTSDKIINTPTDCIEGSILVRFNPSAESRLAKCATRSGATRTGVEGVDRLLDKVNGYAVEPVFVVTEKNRDKVYAQGLHLWYALHFDKQTDLDSLARELSEVAEVKYVEFERKVCRIGTPKPLSANMPTILASAPSSSNIPFNDAHREFQWSLNNLGSNSQVRDGGYVNNLPKVVAGADINVVPAWRLCKGNPSIIVAVLDEGVMYTHEDLTDNIWVNQAEKYGRYGVDDDNNGYADDIYGYNFALPTPNGDICWDLKNDSGHGTHVAGIISAVNNNGKGICGIAGGSGNKDGVKIMSIQIFYGNSGASTANIAKGMQYAADNGAHIMQCSWGYANKDATNDIMYKNRCGAEVDAINYFIANGGTESGPIDGGVVIFAAGNEGFGLPCYPAAYEPCIAVASFNPALRPAYYTDYGNGTDIIAPGGETLYTNGAILSTLPQDFDDPSVPNYGMMQGTSQACPHVSGIAALALSYAQQLGKRFSAKEFRSMILSATNNIDPYLTGGISGRLSDGSIFTMDYPSFSGKLGAGYIDAYKLLLQVDGTPYAMVKQGVDCEIDLSLYFGDGLHHSEFSKVVVSDEDKENIGLGDCIYNAGKLTINCSKIGVAKITVTMLVGGGSYSNSANPFPTEVSKSFVVISKSSTAANNGWL